MKRLILALLYLSTGFIACLFTGTDVRAQSKINKVYTVAEQQPEFPGGAAALSQYLAANIKIPGIFVRKKFNTGPVAARFIIDELGYIRDVRVIAQPMDNSKMRRGMEAYMANIIVAVEKMPRWNPGKVNGASVPVFYTLPIEVSIQ